MLGGEAFPRQQDYGESIWEGAACECASSSKSTFLPTLVL